MEINAKARLFLFILCLIFISICCFFANFKEDEVKEDSKIPTVEYIMPAPTMVDIAHSPWTDDEGFLLAKIAMAEAEGEDIEGKALVINVILNRVQSDEFPDTIEEVIFQEYDGVYQFSPIGNGRFDSVAPNVECWQALDKVRSGYDGSKGALYFTSSTDESTWHSRNLEFLFAHKNHKFYK